jgi:hypothetical protein
VATSRAAGGKDLLVYLINTFIYGTLALVIALPLGARALSSYLLDAFNAEEVFSMSPLAVTAQVAVALLSRR